MTPDWIKFKKYPHIGKPLKKKKDLTWILEYVQDKNKISAHKFTPLLHKQMHQRKFRPDKDALKGKKGKRIRTVQKKKIRPIFYASHLDSIVYSYYSHIVTNAYEAYLKDKSFGNTAVAYRKIPITPGKKGNKCNIEFAYETFQFIEKNKGEKLSMLVADISSFFDNLDHRILHTQWKRVLGTKSLPDDHYNVYKSLIAKRYVNEVELFNRFKDNLIVERGVKNKNSKTKLRNLSVKHIWNLKKENVVAYCTKEDFFKKSIDLIRTIKPCSHQHQRCRKSCKVKGIPQGTPISAALANIYMLDFDENIYEAVLEKKGFFQRYSDDMIIICNQKDEAFFYKLITTAINQLVKLDIQRQKTNIYRYSPTSEGFNGGILDESGKISPDKQLEYLGFEYDGNKVRVKTVGFSKFYRSMKRSFQRGIHFASKPENKNHELFEERLYKRFSYKGAKRRLIWKPDLKSESGYSCSKEQYWGNYISYLEKANRVMKPINQDDNIKKQYRNFWKNFGKEMKSAYKEIAEKTSI